MTTCQTWSRLHVKNQPFSSRRFSMNQGVQSLSYLNHTRLHRDIHPRSTQRRIATGSLEVAGTHDEQATVGTELVDSLLNLVGTSADGSADTSLTESDKDRVQHILEELERIGQGKRPLEDERIYGNYNVSYVSMGKRQYGQPAGGRFRTGFGRFLFRTTGLFQSVLEPNVVVNKVALKIFGFIPCSVGLRGTLVSVPELKEGEQDEKAEDMADTAKVFFNPPMLGLPFGIHTSIGPSSSVVLKTTYVDERVRIGKGSRGSLFVFTRGFESDAAGMDLVGLEKTSLLGKFIVASFIACLMAAGGYLSYRYMTVPHIGGIGLFMVMVGLALTFVVARGGIISTEDDRPEITQPSAA